MQRRSVSHTTQTCFLEILLLTLQFKFPAGCFLNFQTRIMKSDLHNLCHIGFPILFRSRPPTDTAQSFPFAQHVSCHSRILNLARLTFNSYGSFRKMSFFCKRARFSSSVSFTTQHLRFQRNQTTSVFRSFPLQREDIQQHPGNNLHSVQSSGPVGSSSEL